MEIRLPITLVPAQVLPRRKTDKQANRTEVFSEMKDLNQLTVNKISDGSKLTLSLDGYLNTKTSIEINTLLGESLDGITDLVFDLSELKYISSAGMRTLLTAQKKMNSQGSMKVTGVSSDIMEIFDITGFTDVFTIE